MININTVKSSPTMYARRVYEGLASGTPIISNYSLGMEKQFGDIIGYSENEDELDDYLAKLNNDASEYNKIKQLGIRRVLSEHTYKQRLLQVSSKLGYAFKKSVEKVTFIIHVDSKNLVGRAIRIFEDITYSNKELLILVKDNINDYSMLGKGITVVHENRLPEYFETLNKLIKTDYLAPISINDFYGGNYLKDLMIAVLYSNADVIGKQNYFVNKNSKLEEINDASEHEYTETVNINSTIIRSSIFSNFSLQESLKYIKNDKCISELKYLGLKIYSNDKMNYIKHGYKISKEQKYIVIV